MTDTIDELERLHAAATKAQEEDPDYEPGLESSATVAIERAAHAFYRHGPALLATLREIRDAGHENGNICKYWRRARKAERLGAK